MNEISWNSFQFIFITGAIKPGFGRDPGYNILHFWFPDLNGITITDI